MYSCCLNQNLLVSTLRLPLNIALEGSNDYTPSHPANDYYQELNLVEDEFSKLYVW